MDLKPHIVLFVLLLLAPLGCKPADDTGDSLAANAPATVRQSDLAKPAPNATAVSAAGKLPGIYPAASRIKDTEAPGGFGPSNNFSRVLGTKNWGTPGALAIVAFSDEPVAYFKYTGIALRVINRSGNTVAFSACDSRLSIVAEARDENGAWHEIESLPQTFCGNSSHRVFLENSQYFEFPARLYNGTLKTRLRYRLDIGDKSPPIYSNEFAGEINAGQFLENPGQGVQRGAQGESL